MARDAIRWHARAQQLFSDGGFCDSQWVVGTSDVSFEISGPEWSHLEELSREEGVVPFEQVQGVSVAGGTGPPTSPAPLVSADASSSAAGAAPEADLQTCDGIPWRLNGHSVVQASLVPIAKGAKSMPDIFFCKVCGASLHRSFRPGEGLDTVCHGRETPGLKSQRSRLRRGLAPRIEAHLARVRGPEAAIKAAWTARLPSLTSWGMDPGAWGQEAVRGDSASGVLYGTTVPELDDWAVALFHDFSSPGAALDSGQSQRISEDEMFHLGDPSEG